MTIKITIPNEQAPEILEVLQKLLAGKAPKTNQVARVHVQTETPQPEAVEEHTPAPAPAPAPAPEKAKQVELAPVSTTETLAELGSEITLEELRKVVVTKTNEGHSDAMKEILKQMGAATVPALKPHQRNEFLLRINAL